MKRYFLSHDRDMPTLKEYSTMGRLSFIDLASHGPAGDKWNVVCFEDDHAVPKPEWQPFPTLVDSKTTLIESEINQEFLTDLGLTGEETTLETAVKFGAILPTMKP